MNKEDLKAKLDNLSLSALAEDIIRDMIDENDNFQDLYDNYPYEIDRSLIYYSDAFNYLMDENITDYEDAINWGATNITSIAYYYLTEEISNALNDLENNND